MPSAADDGQFTIGLATDLSGKAAFLGLQSKAGAELARRELQAEGVPIKLVVGDHRTDSKTAVTEVTKLLEADHARAILCDTTPAALAAAPLVKRAGRLFLYQSPAHSPLAQSGLAFKNFLDYEQGCRQIAEYFKSTGIKRFAALKAEGEFGELCARGSAAIFPDQLVVDYVSGDDLKSPVTRLKAENIEALIQTGYEIDYINRFSASRELGFAPKSGFPQPLLTKLVREKGGADIEGAIVFGFPPVAPEFIERLKRADLYTTNDSIESAVISYMHVRQLARVFNKCLIGETGCEAAELSKQGPDPLMSFKGWQEQNAKYEWTLRRVSGEALIAVR